MEAQSEVVHETVQETSECHIVKCDDKIYRHNTGRKIDLVEAIFEQFANPERKVRVRRPAENTIPHLHQRYFIHKVPPSGKKALPQRRCVVCTKHGRKKDTRYCCLQCDIGLCLEECFEAYRTKFHS
jgi:hypothetical protein